jgi:Winged helix DNA-binding domain
VTRKELNRATLARQLLLARDRTSPVHAVERLVGLQAQEPRPPFVGLWTRLDDFQTSDLRAALDGDLVRGMAMRATLHLMSARDFAALRMSLQPVMTRAMKGALRGRDQGLDLDRVLPAARELLEEEPRDFNELRALLSERFPDVNHRALGYAVRTQMPLVMVPTDDRWAFPSAAKFALPEFAVADGEDPRPLVLRYLAAFGPATAADAQTWSGLKGSKAVFDDLRDELVTLQDEDGRELFDVPDAPRPGADAEAPPRFLPDFDNLMLAHADRTRVIADEHRGEVVTKNLRVRATFLWDGFVAGTWTMGRKGKTATLRMTPFGRLPKRAVNALSAEGEALLRFVEEDATAFDVKVAE